MPSSLVCAAVAPFRLPPARRLTLALLLGAVALPTLPARAATFNWTGGDSKDDWNLAANWQQNAVPANDGTADLVFGFVGAGVNTSIITPAYAIRSLSLSIAASAYRFGNGPLTLGAGGLFTSAANAQIFDTAVSLGADQTWTLGAGAGALSFNSRVNLNNHALTVNAASTTGAGNVVNGDLIGSGGSLLKTGAGVLALTGTGSTYNGGTTISAGTLAFNNAGALGTGAVTLNAGELRATATATFNQAVNANAGAVSAAPGVTLTLNSLFVGDRFTAGAPGQTGAVTLTNSNGGSLSGDSALTVAAGTLRGGAAGVLSFYAANAASATVNAGATLDLNGFSTAVNNLQGAGAITTGGAAATVLTVNSGSFAGAISGPGALTKSGAGTLTLTGASTYAGTTTVNGDTLAVTSGGSLTGAGDITVNAGATLAISGTGGVSQASGRSLNVNGSTGGGPGTLTLSGGANLSTGFATIGNNGPGSATQSGGAFTTNNTSLVLGFNPSANGAYNLVGGSLSTGQTIISADANTSVFTQSGGTHTTGTLTLGAFSPSANAAYHLDGGTLAASGVTRSAGTGVFNFNGGTLQPRGSTTTFFQGLTNANVRDGGVVINTAGFNVTITQPLLHSTIAGDAGIDGGLIKNGAGTLTLTGANTFTGPVTINAGALAVGAESALGAPVGGTVTVGGGGALQFTGSAALSRNYNLGVSTLAAGAGNTLTFGAGSTVSGGFLAGPGTDVLGDGVTFNGVTTLANSTLTQAAGSTATLNTTTVRGVLAQSGGTLNFNNGLVLGSGRLSVGGTVNTTGTEIQGVTTISSGGTLANGGGSLYLTGGSRTTVAAGGTLSTASGTTIELNGSQLVNNGTQGGVLNVNFGGVAKGAGSFGTVNVTDGGRFSPGNSPGTATLASADFGSGSRLDFELNSATAADGTPGGNGHADLLSISGTLTLSAGTTANSRFTVGLFSLDQSNNPAMLADFDPAHAYTFTLATAAGGIVGFDPAEVFIDATGFKNDMAGGSFALLQQGNSLVVAFSPVPEPSTWALVAGGLGWLTLLRRCQQRRWTTPGRP